MIMVMKTLVCFFLPFLSMCNRRTYGDPINYNNCGPDTLKGVDLTPCSQQPCVFHKGENVTVTINFDTTSEVSAVKTHVYGIVAGVPVPYSLPNENGCLNCNLNCPLAADTSNSYINVFPVLKSYPVIRLTVKWTLVDENDNDIVCFLFPMEIQE